MFFKKPRLYMDFASSTPLHARVMTAMRAGLINYGNPSAPHQEGRRAKTLLEEARVTLARTLSVKPETLTFTGSGTESNNLAIFGVCEGLKDRGMALKDMHVISTSFEHPSVSAVLKQLEGEGVAVSYAEPNEQGRVTVEAIQKLLRPETVLVSVMAVQSEIGVIQPLKDIARLLESFRNAHAQTAQPFAPEALFPVLHSDASQSSLFIDFSPDRLGVDIASYDAQKVMGPKGIGALYRNLSVPYTSILKGGTQEKSMRPGTENVSHALGMAEAFRIAKEGREGRVKRVSALRDYFITLLEQELPQVEVNGGVKHRIANNVHISVPRADGDYLAVLMDQEGIAVSPRSACIAFGVPSPTVRALGKNAQTAQGTLRFSFSPWVTKSEIKRAVFTLKKVLASDAVVITE